MATADMEGNANSLTTHSSRLLGQDPTTIQMAWMRRCAAGNLLELEIPLPGRNWGRTLGTEPLSGDLEIHAKVREGDVDGTIADPRVENRREAHEVRECNRILIAEGVSRRGNGSTRRLSPRNTRVYGIPHPLASRYPGPRTTPATPGYRRRSSCGDLLGLFWGPVASHFLFGLWGVARANRPGATFAKEGRPVCDPGRFVRSKWNNTTGLRRFLCSGYTLWTGEDLAERKRSYSSNPLKRSSHGSRSREWDEHSTFG